MVNFDGSTPRDAIYSIEKEHFHYYLEKNARVVKITVGFAPDGGKYLKTELDTEITENLLSLPEFPPLTSGMKK